MLISDIKRHRRHETHLFLFERRPDNVRLATEPYIYPVGSAVVVLQGLPVVDEFVEQVIIVLVLGNEGLKGVSRASDLVSVLAQ